MSVEQWTGRVICDAPSPPCHATLEVEVDEGGYVPVNGSFRCTSCGNDICASHAVGAKDGVCKECVETKAPLSADEAAAFARALVELDPLGAAFRVASHALMRLCPHPLGERATYIGLRLDCAICGVVIGTGDKVVA